MRARAGLLLTAAALLGHGCDRQPSMAPEQRVAPVPQPAARIPLGPPPGQINAAAQRIHNPYAGDPVAAADGKRLFGAMNCAYCHGPKGGGLMGPSLDDRGWRFGGTPAEIYNSIDEGRPKGMPAWGTRLPPDQIWRLVAYIETLGGVEEPGEGSSPSLAARANSGPQPAGQSESAPDLFGQSGNDPH